MGRYEKRDTSAWARLKAKLAVRAKALAAGLAALVVGEVVLVLSDNGVVELIQQVVPAPLQPLIPVVTAGIVLAITHAAPKNAEPTE